MWITQSNVTGVLYYRHLLAERLSTRFGIVSFTTEPVNALMWAHYTRDGSGFVIGYDMDQISESLTEGTYSWHQVKYVNQPTPMISDTLIHDALANPREILSRKGSHWSYENEYRLIVELNSTIGLGKKDALNQPINVIRVPNEAVRRVYFTERTPQCTVQLIGDRLSDPNNRYAGRRPRKLVLSRTAYKYEPAPI